MIISVYDDIPSSNDQNENEHDINSLNIVDRKKKTEESTTTTPSTFESFYSTTAYLTFREIQYFHAKLMTFRWFSI